MPWTICRRLGRFLCAIGRRRQPGEQAPEPWRDLRCACYRGKKGSGGRLRVSLRRAVMAAIPQMLELDDDLDADWFLDCGNRHRHRRRRPAALDHHRAVVKSAPPARMAGPRGSATSNTEPVSVAPGVSEAASDHIRTWTVRIRVGHTEMKAEHRKLTSSALSYPVRGERVGADDASSATCDRGPCPGRKDHLAVLRAEVWQHLSRSRYQPCAAVRGGPGGPARSAKTAS